MADGGEVHDVENEYKLGQVKNRVYLSTPFFFFFSQPPSGIARFDFARKSEQI